jgi:hypothetical protein
MLGRDGSFLRGYQSRSTYFKRKGSMSNSDGYPGTPKSAGTQRQTKQPGRLPARMVNRQYHYLGGFEKPPA